MHKCDKNRTKFPNSLTNSVPALTLLTVTEFTFGLTELQS